MAALYATLAQVRTCRCYVARIAKQDCKSMLLYAVIGYQHDLLHVIKVCRHASIQHGALESTTLVMKLSLLAFPFHMQRLRLQAV